MRAKSIFFDISTYFETGRGGINDDEYVYRLRRHNRRGAGPADYLNHQS